MSGSQQVTVSQAQTFWIQWVEAAFPHLDSRAYFLPPVYFNRVPMNKGRVGDQDVIVLPPYKGQDGQFPTVQDSDRRDDLAVQRVLFCLQKWSEKTKEVLFGIIKLPYFGTPGYNGLAMPPVQGDFDVLLIHRHYGLVICEVKAFGDNLKDLSMKQQDIDKNIRKKLKEAMTQLDKAEAMLSHLVSDIAPGLRITKTIAVPNLTTCQVRQAVSEDSKLTQDLCRWLGIEDPAAIPGLCLCSDHLSDRWTPWNVNSHVVRELGDWWQRRVAGVGPDSHMTNEVYKTLVARFCGPATTVTVPSAFAPRLSVQTLGQAVWLTGEFYTALITLFPEQVDLLCHPPSRLFATGPPGTGKTVMLLMMGTEWLRLEHKVHIVSTWRDSRASCIMLYYLLLQSLNTLNMQVLPDQLHLLQFDMKLAEDVEKAVNDLSQAATEGSLHVIADEVGGNFKNFCDKLLTRVPHLHLWAASSFHANAPARWQQKLLRRPLRSPPVIVREVEQDEFINDKWVLRYLDRVVPDHTDGPPVRQLYHRGQGHSGSWSGDCVTCGREVASFLHSLRVENPAPPNGQTTPPGLQWRDMMVLYVNRVNDESGMVTGMREAGIPVRVMKDDDMEDVVRVRRDVVWVADGDLIRGLERKVVVCLQSHGYYNSRFHLMSRCTAQLVIVSPD